MAISREEVEHVARLARLDLTDEEVERFREQLSVVLERAQRIQALDLDDVPATPHPLDLSNVLRADEIVPPVETDRITDGGPAREGAFYRVPKILEDED